MRIHVVYVLDIFIIGDWRNWLAHVLWEHGVASSSLASPTIFVSDFMCFAHTEISSSFSFLHLYSLDRPTIVDYKRYTNLLWRYRLVVRTSGFHPANRSSILRSATIYRSSKKLSQNVRVF